MVPTCQCPCGARLELRHAASRDLVQENGNWAVWRLRFRCPRCARSVVRQFEVRMLDVEAQPLEMYERAVSLHLEPIAENEAETLLANDAEALAELRRQVSST